MKLPKSFKPQTDLDKKTENLLERAKEIPDRTIETILNTFTKFMASSPEFSQVNHNEVRYMRALNMVHELDYNKTHIEKVHIEDCFYAPSKFDVHIYFSALVNNLVYKEKNLILNLGFADEIHGIGMYLMKDSLTINGHIGGSGAYSMKGGEFIVNGNTGNWFCNSVSGGKIIVNGEVGGCVGELMHGNSVLYVNGDSFEKYQIARDCVSEIYHKGKIIHERKT